MCFEHGLHAIANAAKPECALPLHDDKSGDNLIFTILLQLGKIMTIMHQ